MDAIDRRILAELQQDGRLSLTVLAARVQLSMSPTHRRLHALEASGAITGYRAVIDPEVVGLGFGALVFVTMEQANQATIPAFDAAVAKIPEVIQALRLFGDPDYLLRIADAFDAGRIVADRLRGRSSLSHPVQAAQHYAREALGDDRIGAYPPIEELATDGGWRVRLGLDAGADVDGEAASIVVELAEESSPPLLSTCAATRLVQVRQYALRGIA